MNTQLTDEEWEDFLAKARTVRTELAAITAAAQKLDGLMVTEVGNLEARRAPEREHTQAMMDASTELAEAWNADGVLVRMMLGFLAMRKAAPALQELVRGQGPETQAGFRPAKKGVS